MTIPWQPMTVKEFARFRCSFGERVIESNGIFWRQVRPFFFRPLLPYKEYQATLVKPPPKAWWGGFQYAVPQGPSANSSLNLLLFQDAENYSLETLSDQHRRQIKSAARQWVVRQITDREEFKQSAYPVYLSFYERTRYPFAAQRTRRDYFSQWADRLFQIPKAMILGGYHNGRLGGVSVSLLVDDTVHYPTVFCDTESLRAHLSSFMLHTVREAVAQSRCARQIFAGLGKSAEGRTVDQFYLQRGCQPVRQPARLVLNPVAASLLKRFARKPYAHLMGESSPSLKPVNPPGRRIQNVPQSAPATNSRITTDRGSSTWN